MRDKETGLTTKQLAFAKNYPLDFNVQRVYTSAEYETTTQILKIVRTGNYDFTYYTLVTTQL